jgi:hypothetical protein
MSSNARDREAPNGSSELASARPSPLLPHCYALSVKRLLFAILLASASTIQAAKPVVERTENLGFGFRRVMLAEPVSVSFESIGHFEYLCYRDQGLCRVGECSVSPSGKFAIYQDGLSGNLFLFRRVDRKVTQLTRKFIALAERFEWHEGSSTVDAHLKGNRLKTFTLQ